MARVYIIIDHVIALFAIVLALLRLPIVAIVIVVFMNDFIYSKGRGEKGVQKYASVN